MPPIPAGSFFERCDVSRCTDTSAALEAGGTFHQWNLDPPFPDGERDYAFVPNDDKDGNKCFFPVYNRTEIRAMTQEQGGVWLITSGGSNSYGAASAIFKAVHDDGKSSATSTSMHEIRLLLERALYKSAYYSHQSAAHLLEHAKLCAVLSETR